MKKFFFFLIVATIAGNVTFAQTSGSTDQRAQMQQIMKQYLKDSIKLSDVMIDSVMAVRSAFQPQMRSIFMDQSLTADEKQAKMETLKKELGMRYKTIGLSDDQVIKIEEHDKRMREQMHNKINGGNNNK